MLDPGKRRHLVTLQSPVITKGTSGGVQTDWVTVSQPWAAIRQTTGTERPATAAAGGQVAEASTEFNICYRPGVSSLMRVLYQGAVYDIKHVNNVHEKNEELVLTCTTGINNG